MEHQEVRSSNIKSIGHDAQTRTLEVRFHAGGRTYQYHDVDADTHAKILHAKSVGKALYQHVINKGIKGHLLSS